MSLSFCGQAGAETRARWKNQFDQELRANQMLCERNRCQVIYNDTYSKA